MANNLSGGFIGRQKLTDTSFVTGQRTGDLTSLLLGITEISAGGGMTQAGGLALSAGGAGAAVGAPMTAAGLALAGHGIIVTNSAVRNLASDNFVHAKSKHKGESQASNDFLGKGGGKNDQHANPDAKGEAHREWLKAKAELARIKQESRGKPGRQKMIKEAEARVKHWQSQANFKGENHSRNAKGNNNGGKR